MFLPLSGWFVKPQRKRRELSSGTLRSDTSLTRLSGNFSIAKAQRAVRVSSRSRPLVYPAFGDIAQVSAAGRPRFERACAASREAGSPARRVRKNSVSCRTGDSTSPISESLSHSIQNKWDVLLIVVVVCAALCYGVAPQLTSSFVAESISSTSPFSTFATCSICWSASCQRFCSIASRTPGMVLAS